MRNQVSRLIVLAPRKLSGKAKIAPSSVPRTAIDRVSPRPLRISDHSAQVCQTCGGNMKDSTRPKRSIPVQIRAGDMSKS